MRTRVYIDGYNLYFGSLKGTPYKWLNPVSLVEKLLKRSGSCNTFLDPLSVKYFTAEINARAATDPNSLNDQRAYHLALNLFLKDELSLFRGSYSIDEAKAPKVEKSQNNKNIPIPKSERVKIWKMEEKQSDVSLAVEALYDAIMEPTIEQFVFVTNDTDLIPALQKIRDYKHGKDPVKIGLIAPIREDDLYRKPNGSLSRLADWTVRYISNEELCHSQLPCRIPGTPKTAIKPLSWFKHPQKVEEILNILSDKEVLNSIPRSWKWLDKPLLRVDGLPHIEGAPVESMDNESALTVISVHAQAFAAHKKSS